MRTIMLCVLLAGAYAEVPSKLVKTAQGSVRGYKNPNYDVYVFHSVPYATAPTGRNRFKAPLPPPTWQQTYEALDKEIVCPQPDFGFMPKSKKIQEDCLIANIYVPVTDQVNIPVVLYVHGGAYIMGYGDMVDPKGFVNTKKVIIITFNYRVGGHGFLCLGTKDIPGNAGMKDQVAMLRWINKNIANFGGNPNDVTIVGSSGGSSAVDLLMISKTTKGLFSKVIPESGANTGAFSIQSDPIRVAKEYAQLLNYTADNIYDLEEFFKSISVEHLNSLITLNRTDATFLVSPCVERDTREEMFLDDGPVNILKSGNYTKVPMLYGFANMEGLLRVNFIGGEIENDLERMNKNFSEFLPADLDFESAEEREAVATKIKTFFFGDKVNEDDMLDYVNYFSDVYFAYSTLRSAKLQVEAGNDHIYLYEYSFTDDTTPYVPFTKVRGANHCDHSILIWEFLHMDHSQMSEDKKKMQKNLKEIWLNFILNGKPAESSLLEWPPVGRKWSPHISIGKALELRGSLLKERTLFWEEIYAKHYRASQPPPTPPPKRAELIYPE